MAKLDHPARASILAGKTLTSIWEGGQANGLTRKELSELRKTVMAELNASPENVKALADGPLLNANAIVKYKGRPRKFTPPPVQLSILDIVDGHMNGAAA